MARCMAPACRARMAANWPAWRTPYTYNPAVQTQSLHMLAFGSPYLNLGYFPYCILLSNLALHYVRCCECVLESKTVQNSTDRLQYSDLL
eukprot:SAG22_NODE_12724_length_431_cov_1.551205_1_plen_89_part_01